MPEKKNTQTRSSPALPYKLRKPTVPEAQIRKSWQAISKCINEAGPDDEETDETPLAGSDATADLAHPHCKPAVYPQIQSQKIM